MLTERLNRHNLFYYINHTQSEKLDPQDRTNALVGSIFIGVITAGLAQLGSLIYYSRFCQCCRVKTSSSLNINLPTPPPIPPHGPKLSSPPLPPAPEFLSEINRKNKQKTPTSNIKITHVLAQNIVGFIGFNKTDLHNLALVSKEWKAAVNSSSPIRCLSFVQQMRQKMQPEESQEAEPKVKEKLSKDWDHTYEENFSERAGMGNVYAKVDPDYAVLKQLLRGECDPKLLENKAFKYLITENVILLAKAASTHPEIMDLISSPDLKQTALGLAKYFRILSSQDRAKTEKADLSIFNKIALELQEALAELNVRTQTNKDVVFAVVESVYVGAGNINPIFLNDEDIAFSLVRQNGTNLKWVDAKFRKSWKFAWAALDNAGSALRYVDDSIKMNMTRDHLLAIAKKHPALLEVLPIYLQNDEEFFVAVVSENGDAIDAANEGMKKNERVALTALKNAKTGMAYRALDASLKSRKDILLAAIRKNMTDAVDETTFAWREDIDVALALVNNGYEGEDAYIIPHARAIIKAAKTLLGEAFDPNDLHSLVCNSTVMQTAAAQKPGVFLYMDASLWEDKIDGELRAAILTAIANEREVYSYVGSKLKKDITFVRDAYNENSTIDTYIEDIGLGLAMVNAEGYDTGGDNPSICREAEILIDAAKSVGVNDLQNLHGLLSNKAVMLAAAMKMSKMFKYIDVELWKDPEVIAAVLTAIAMYHNVYQDVTPELAKNIEFADKALKANKEVWSLLDTSFQIELKAKGKA